MTKIPIVLSDSNVLLCGLAFTSRTETVEDYLKDKVKSLTVIALSSCFLKERLSSCRVYESGRLVNKFQLPAFLLKDYKWYRQPLVLAVFLVYFAAICQALIRVKKKHDLYIGISHSFGLWGAIFKKLGWVKHLIYYCIDYYEPSKKREFNTIFVKMINFIDRFTVKNADIVWDLSEKIPVKREELGKIKIGTYKETVVPLGYSRHMRQFKDFGQINRWQIGFVGSVSENQGLQLLVEAMPEILARLPEINVTIIGQGPYLAELKNMVAAKGLNDKFTFYGFVQEEGRMLDILSGCAIGVALYTPAEGSNAACADTGKPKLYAFLGLPIITTTAYSRKDEVSSNKAGMVIAYESTALADAVCDLLSDESRLKSFKDNSYRFGEGFVSDKIFDAAVQKMEMGENGLRHN